MGPAEQQGPPGGAGEGGEVTDAVIPRTSPSKYRAPRPPSAPNAPSTRACLHHLPISPQPHRRRGHGGDKRRG